MDAPYLAVPVVRDGQLGQLSVCFHPHRDFRAASISGRTREKAHFLRDALVRASHADDLADPNDANALNEARAIDVYRAAAIQALGERAVGPITIVATYSSRGGGV